VSRIALIDLAASDDATREERCQVCIVGAGAAGIYLARRLAARGMSTLLVEAGGANCVMPEEIGFEADFAADPYPGATQGRSFGLGGTTSRWGGLLFPHTEADRRNPPEFEPDVWPRIIADVAEFADDVLTHLRYGHGGEFRPFACRILGPAASALSDAGLLPGASLYLPFRAKNLATLLRRGFPGQANLRIVVNAVASSWSIAGGESPDGARLRALTAIAPNGRRLEVTADRFVISAGAIESARMLLELNGRFAAPVIRRTAAIGAYLSDHLSLPMADVAPTDRKKAVRTFAPRFCRGWMRSFRFLELAPPPGPNRAYAHFIFDNTSAAFGVAKEVLTALQARRRPKLTAGEVAAGIGGIAALAWGRYARAALHVPTGTGVRLQLDIEQIPAAANRIELGPATDRFGRRRPVIHWRITAADVTNMEATARRVLESWRRAGALYRGLPALLPRDLRAAAERPYDVYHPVGACRMGEDAESVVDSNLRVWGVDNLWVVSTAVLPSAGTANPTFTMLCLAEGLARRMTVPPA